MQASQIPFLSKKDALNYVTHDKKYSIKKDLTLSEYPNRNVATLPLPHLFLEQCVNKGG